MCSVVPCKSECSGRISNTDWSSATGFEFCLQKFEIDLGVSTPQFKPAYKRSDDETIGRGHSIEFNRHIAAPHRSGFGRALMSLRMYVSTTRVPNLEFRATILWPCWLWGIVRVSTGYAGSELRPTYHLPWRYKLNFLLQLSKCSDRSPDPIHDASQLIRVLLERLHPWCGRLPRLHVFRECLDGRLREFSRLE